MSLRKRISGSRDQRRDARADRREERVRAAEARRAAAADRAKVRTKTDEADDGAKRADRPAERRPAARKVGGGAASVGAELAKLARELVAIPVQLWLTAAEFAGGIVLWVWRRAVRPVLLGALALARATVRFGERHLTPARGVILASLAAIIALGASQWVEYHSVSVGIDAYAGDVGTIAPAPEVESEIAGNAHSFVMVPLAIGAFAAIVAAVAWRRRAAALLVPIGIAVVAITLIVDLPKGLDEGAAAVTYEGAKASLLGGFWLQLACALVLIACGLMLPRYLSPAAAAAGSPTGPTLIDRGVGFARRHARRPARPRVKLPRARAKRKVQGAGT